MFEDLRREVKNEGSSNRQGKSYAEEIKIESGANIIRLVNPDNYVQIGETWILCEDGVKRPFIVKNSHEGVSVLGRLIGDSEPFKYYKGGILETIKDENNQKKDKWVSVEDPEIMELVKYNGDRSGNQGSWKISKKWLFNAIHRAHEDDGTNWCIENKHTKVLKVGQTVTESLFDIYDNNGPLDQYDINILKKGQGRTGTSYQVIKPDPTKVAQAIIGEISEEEKLYELWKLKEITKLSSAGYILKYIRNYIIRIDRVMGTNFLGELEAQANVEKEEWEKSKNSETSAEASIERIKTGPSESIQQQSRVAVNQPEQPAPIQSEDIPTQEVHPEVAEELAPPVPDNVTPIKREVSRETTTNTEKCPKCNAFNPVGTEVCTSCKATLLLPCDTCGEMMSAYSEECTACGTKYKLSW